MVQSDGTLVERWTIPQMKQRKMCSVRPDAAVKHSLLFKIRRRWYARRRSRAIILVEDEDGDATAIVSYGLTLIEELVDHLGWTRHSDPSTVVHADQHGLSDDPRSPAVSLFTTARLMASFYAEEARRDVKRKAKKN